MIKKLYKIILIEIQYLNLPTLGFLGPRDPPRVEGGGAPKVPSVKQHPNISGLCQGSLDNYMLLNSISQLPTLNPNSHEKIILANCLEFDICYFDRFIDC